MGCGFDSHRPDQYAGGPQRRAARWCARRDTSTNRTCDDAHSGRRGEVRVLSTGTNFMMKLLRPSKVILLIGITWMSFTATVLIVAAVMGGATRPEWWARPVCALLALLLGFSAWRLSGYVKAAPWL